MKTKEMCYYLLIRLFIVILGLNLFSAIPTQGGIFYLLFLALIFMVSSGWIILIASNVIEKNYFPGILLFLLACIVDFFTSKLLFNGVKGIGTHILYASSCALSFFIVYFREIFNPKIGNG